MLCEDSYSEAGIKEIRYINEVSVQIIKKYTRTKKKARAVSMLFMFSSEALSKKYRINVEVKFRF